MYFETSYKNDMEKATFGKKIREWAKNYKNNVAIFDGENQYSYEEMASNSLKLSRFFLSKGVCKGDNVILQLSNSATLIFCMLGLFEIGAVPIMVLPAYRENELVGIISLAQPTMYLSLEEHLERDYVAMAKNFYTENSCIKNLFFEQELSSIFANDFLYNSDGKEYEKPQPEDLALLLLSGGTTGTPKLIPRTHMDYIYNNKMAAERCKLTNDDIYLACMPIVHNFTLGAPGILGTFYVGGSVVISKSTGPLEIFDAIEENKVTFTSLVPSIALFCTQILEWDDSFNLQSMRKILIGGSILERSLAEKVKKFFPCELIQVFGTAEGLISTTSLNDDFETIITTQGKPISPLDEIKIVNTEGEEVKTGELITRGPYTIRGYYRLEEENKKCFTPDGFYRTGDKARLTKAGNLQILGRVREQINRSGEKIMPSEIEEHIIKHPDVKDCSVVGALDELTGNRICAFIVADCEITMRDMCKFLENDGLAHYKLPDCVLKIDSLPLTAFGKVDKTKLQDIIKSQK